MVQLSKLKELVDNLCLVCNSRKPLGSHTGSVLLRDPGDSKSRFSRHPDRRAAPTEPAADRTSYGDTENTIQHHV